MKPRYDAVVVGAGPNGLAAAIALAQAKWQVLLLEANEAVGGGTRTAELTLPGFRHDVCSATHPLAMSSPYLRTLPLEQHGLEWIHPTYLLVQPLDGGKAAVMERSLDATAERLGRDGRAYRKLFAPLVKGWDGLLFELLRPLRPPRHPFLMARFGLSAIRSAERLAKRVFKDEPARALFSGQAAHSFLALDRPTTSGFGLMLAVAGHAVGWPAPRGGSQGLADAMAAYLRSLGGEIVTGHRVERLDALPPTRAVLLDVTPRQLLRIAGDKLPAGYRARLERYRYGPGVFKMDFALSAPMPWSAPEGRQAGTLHLGGTFDEVAAGEAAVVRGEHPERPFVLVAQHSLFDDSRAPAGKHALWAYCHVPHGSTVDMSERIEAQLERFAPGFRDLVLARSARGPAQLERYNENLIGGDICGGSQGGLQMFMRPITSWVPYRTPVKGLYLCSASTPPGPGVHGMCGYHAAMAVLRDAR